MNTSPTSSHAVGDPVKDQLELSPEPLSAQARAFREANLPLLRSRVTARRTRRLANRAAAALVLAVAVVLGVRLIPATGMPAIPSPKVVHRPLPTPTNKPETRPAPAEPRPAFAITVLRNDPTIISRYAAKPSSGSVIIELTDEQLLAALDAAGTPGFIKIDGRVVLSRDLEKPKPEDTPPQSSARTDSSHG